LCLIFFFFFYYQEFIGQLDDIQRVQLLRVVQPLGPVVYDLNIVF
jgi:hypothetical protein